MVGQNEAEGFSPFDPATSGAYSADFWTKRRPVVLARKTWLRFNECMKNRRREFKFIRNAGRCAALTLAWKVRFRWTRRKHLWKHKQARKDVTAQLGHLSCGFSLDLQSWFFFRICVFRFCFSNRYLDCHHREHCPPETERCLRCLEKGTGVLSGQLSVCSIYSPTNHCWLEQKEQKTTFISPRR